MHCFQSEFTCFGKKTDGSTCISAFIVSINIYNNYANANYANYANNYANNNINNE